MRRMLPGSKVFWTGLLVLPVMAAGVLAISRPSLAAPQRVARTVQTPNGPITVYEEIDDGERAFPSQESLLAGETPDAAEAEKSAQLREKLRTVIDEKASLLNSAALEAEIALHQRQIVELKAQQELRQLRRGLQELSDKFPESDAGRQAKDILEILKSRVAGQPIRMVPVPDAGFAPVYSPTPAQPYEPPDASVPARPRRSTPVPDRPVPKPIEGEKPFGAPPGT